MSAPFSETAIVGYNTNPPANDGTETAANTVDWDNHINNIGDPVKNYATANFSNVSTAFAKVVGGSGVTSVNSDYVILSTDQGKAITYVGAGGHTLTTPDATIVGSPFVFAITNVGDDSITFDGHSSQTVNGETNLTILQGQGGFVFTDGSNWFLVTSPTPVVETPTGVVADPPPEFSYSGTEDLVFEDRDCAADDATHTLMTGTALTKDVSSTFVAGDGNGCLDTGTLAQGWYAVFAIAAADLVQDFLISLSDTSPTMPSGFTLKRRIGWIYINVSVEIEPFMQNGDWVYWETSSLDQNGDPGAGANVTVLCPPNTLGKFGISMGNNDDGTTCNGFVRPTWATSWPSVCGMKQSSGTAVASGWAECPVDENQQVRCLSSGGPDTYTLNTMGYLDRRGRDG